MTRILITSLNYAPEETGIAPYSTGLAEHLAAQGYRVTVAARACRTIPEWRVRTEYAGPASSWRSSATASRSSRRCALRAVEAIGAPPRAVRSDVAA